MLNLLVHHSIIKKQEKKPPLPPHLPRRRVRIDENQQTTCLGNQIVWQSRSLIRGTWTSWSIWYWAPWMLLIQLVACISSFSQEKGITLPRYFHLKSKFPVKENQLTFLPSLISREKCAALNNTTGGCIEEKRKKNYLNIFLFIVESSCHTNAPFKNFYFYFFQRKHLARLPLWAGGAGELKLVG